MDITSYLLGKQSSGGGSSDLDWSALGYSERPAAIDYGYNYALQIQNNWVPATILNSKFQSDKKLMFMPLVDTSNSYSMSSMFDGCTTLQEIALLDTSKSQATGNMFSGCTALYTIPVLDLSGVTSASNMSSMFYNCRSLSDESLDNVLKMCIGTKFSGGTKTLKYLGFSQTYYPVSKIQSLPSYQDFLNAGWTIGYE